MDASLLEEYLHKYQGIEDSLLDIAEYVPLVLDFDAPNYAFSPPKAAEFALECGTWLETLMTELLNDVRLDDFPGIEKLRGDPNMNAYRKSFEARFGFSKGGWGLKGQKEPEIRPFESWSRNENPEWFRLFSKKKHHRRRLAEEWTLWHTLCMFVAITMVIQHWDKPQSWKKRKSRVLEGVVY